MQEVIDVFENLHIEYKLIRHPAVFSKADDYKVKDIDFGGVICKNLFVKDKKANKFYLVSLPKDKRAAYEGADGKVYIHKGDARHLDFIPDGSIDLRCTHPPYADIIKYREDIKEDLSHLKIKDFLEEMKTVATESYRVLKKDKFCAVLMGDTRQKGHMIPMSFDVMRIFEDAGFKLKELIINEQHNCKATGYWKTNSVKYNFLLIAHEYLFVFRK